MRTILRLIGLGIVVYLIRQYFQPGGKDRVRGVIDRVRNPDVYVERHRGRRGGMEASGVEQQTQG